MRAVTTWIAPITFTSIWTPSKKLLLEGPRGGASRARRSRCFQDAQLYQNDRLQRCARLHPYRARAITETGVDLLQEIRPGSCGSILVHPYSGISNCAAAKRPDPRGLQPESWGRTLASIYSVRPRPKATVSTPVTWREVERGVRIEDFTIRNIPARVAKLGDLWAPLLEKRGRFSLEKFV